MTTGNEALALQTEGISKHFGAVKAVDELSLSIPRQGATSIVGPNGSGKSTLVNLLSGVLPLDGGMVIIDGVGLRVVHAHETPEHGLTRTFQEVRLFDQITVWDNIMVVLTERRLFSSLLERVRPANRRKAQEILESVGMWEKRGLAGHGTVLRPAQVVGNRPRDGDGRPDLPLRRTLSPDCSRRCWSGSRTS